jgi:hypothetical protein
LLALKMKLVGISHGNDATRIKEPFLPRLLMDFYRKNLNLVLYCNTKDAAEKNFILTFNMEN